MKKRKKGIFFEFACFVFTKVLIEDNTFTSPTGDGIDILRGHLSHVNVQPFAGQRQYSTFISQLSDAEYWFDPWG